MSEKTDWLAYVYTVVLIVVVREFAVWLMGLFNHPELGNLIGLGILLIGLVAWRQFYHISPRIIEANAKIMKESALAFLPVSAGSVLMLFTLGNEVFFVVFILFASTLIPLWVFAKLSKRWLN